MVRHTREMEGGREGGSEGGRDGGGREGGWEGGMGEGGRRREGGREGKEGRGRGGRDTKERFGQEKDRGSHKVRNTKSQRVMEGWILRETEPRWKLREGVRETQGPGVEVEKGKVVD